MHHPSGLNSSETEMMVHFWTTFWNFSYQFKNLSGSVNGDQHFCVSFWRTASCRNSNTSTTEEFNRSASVITAGAWASGGAMPLQDKMVQVLEHKRQLLLLVEKHLQLQIILKTMMEVVLVQGGDYPQSYTTIGTFGTQTAALVMEAMSLLDLLIIPLKNITVVLGQQNDLNITFVLLEDVEL